MSTALPKIDQAGKPAGVGGLSRDDLDLFTAPGTEIQLSDVGGDALTWQWTLIDQPPGATASLTSPNAITTLLTGATVAGSYLVQLAVDGGLVPGSIRRIIAGIQLDTPTWVVPPLNRPLRIPAKGETFEFNVESSPGSGANIRGWAQEIDHWFRTLIAYAFGVTAANDSVPVGGEPFFMLNFVGGGASDAGSGVLNVTASFTPAHDLSNVPTPQTVVGIQSTPVDATAPIDLQALVYQASLSAWAPTTLTEDMIQPAFQVASFSDGASPEVGQTVTTPSFSASYTPVPQLPDTAILTDSDGTPPQNVSGTPTLFSSAGAFVKNIYGESVTFTLSVTKGGFPKVRTTSLQWRRYVYWGGASQPGVYTEAFIKALVSKSLTNTRNRTFNADGGVPGSDVHIYYAFRSGYDPPPPKFWVGGFEGGFVKVATVSVTTENPSAIAENYDLYESDQAGLGSTDVTVTD